MAMRDRHVFVLLIVTWYRILETFRAQALFQLSRRCQVNFIASDTFFSRISFKGEKKWEGIFSVLYAKWKHGRWQVDGHKKKGHQTKFKIQSISKCDSVILLLLLRIVLCIKNMKLNMFYCGTRNKTENRPLMTKNYLFCLFSTFDTTEKFIFMKTKSIYLHVFSYAPSSCTPMQTSSGRYRIHEVYHLQSENDKKKLSKNYKSINEQPATHKN